MYTMKVLGRRSQSRRPGFHYLAGFLELLERLRSVPVGHPRGVFRFRTFEEAQLWWEHNRIPLKPGVRERDQLDRAYLLRLQAEQDGEAK
jgi:hypothetical protein